MLRLKSRDHSIPNGFTFRLPAIKWDSIKAVGRQPSFTRLADGVERAVRGNPAQAKANKWPTDRHAIEEWVDAYNATVCARMGWDAYYTSDSGSVAIPKSSPLHQQSLVASLKSAAAAAKELVRGAKTLMEWDESGEPPVPPEQALERAIVCSRCPLNQPGDFTAWFTVPAAELIQRRIAKAQKRGLETPRDDALHLCTACHCPLKLKVHVPIAWITKRFTPAQLERLKKGNSCWILAEMGKR